MPKAHRCKGCPYSRIDFKTMFDWYRESPEPHPCHKKPETKCRGAVEFIAEVKQVTQKAGSKND